MIEALKEKMKGISDSQLNESFIGSQNLNKEQRELVDFVFWLCYTAETDLEQVIREAWERASSLFTDNSNKAAEQALFERLKGYRKTDEAVGDFSQKLSSLSHEDRESLLEYISGNYQQKRAISTMTDLPYFIDKIKLYEGLFGHNAHVTMFYKINDIRNALSHNKLNELTYNGESLELRGTKEKVLIDYLATMLEDSNFEQSEIWQSLSTQEKEWIKKQNEKMGPVQIVRK